MCKQKMELRVKQIKKVQNVFVSHWGILLKNGLLLAHSAENLKGNYDATFYWKHWRLGAEQYLVSKYGTSLPKVFLDEGLFFSVHTPWFGYFSWVTTCLPRLIKIHSKFPHAKLIFPAEWQKISFVRDSLKLFPELQIEVLEAETHAFVKHFVHAETRAWTSYFYPEDLILTRNFLKKHKSLKEDKYNCSRLYISRARARRRKIQNEDELISVLTEQGFKVVYWEDYSFFEQVALARQASVLIGLHGAGLTNVHFMREGSTVFELNIKVDPSLLRVPFWRMSGLLELNYFVQHCDRTNNYNAPYDDDVVVCLTTFKAILNKVLKAKL